MGVPNIDRFLLGMIEMTDCYLQLCLIATKATFLTKLLGVRGENEATELKAKVGLRVVYIF